MVHPLVEQLRFARSEFRRGVAGVTDEEVRRRFLPMNSISWNIGHLAWQEQRYWLTRAQDQTPLPELNRIVASGGPATTPPLREMLAAWRKVTKAVDPWLDSLADAELGSDLGGPGPRRSVGDSLHRVTYHYWFHVGEILAIRQVLGHSRLPEFVGDIERRAPYRSEASRPSR